MIVRFEETKDDIVLVIDETNKYLGKMFIGDFAECIDDSKEPIDEDEHVFWFVNKECLNKKLVN